MSAFHVFLKETYYSNGILWVKYPSTSQHKYWDIFNALQGQYCVAYSVCLLAAWSLPLTDITTMMSSLRCSARLFPLPVSAAVCSLGFSFHSERVKRVFSGFNSGDWLGHIQHFRFFSWWALRLSLLSGLGGCLAASFSKCQFYEFGGISLNMFLCLSFYGCHHWLRQE